MEIRSVGQEEAGNTNNQLGVTLSGGAQIVSGGAGTTTVEGIGGNVMDGFNMGVVLNGVNTLISSSGGDVFVTGQGGGAGGIGLHNYGVNVYAAAEISVGGTGNVTIDGTGGASDGGYNYGVIVFNPTSAITSTDGNIHIIAQGGGTGLSVGNLGFQVQTQGIIAAGGTGNVLIEATGGASTGGANYGALIWQAGTSITTNNGDINIVGNGNGILNSNSNVGVYVIESDICRWEGNYHLAGTGAHLQSCQPGRYRYRLLGGFYFKWGYYYIWYTGGSGGYGIHIHGSKINT